MRIPSQCVSKGRRTVRLKQREEREMHENENPTAPHDFYWEQYVHEAIVDLCRQVFRRVYAQRAPAFIAQGDIIVSDYCDLVSDAVTLMYWAYKHQEEVEATLGKLIERKETDSLGPWLIQKHFGIPVDEWMKERVSAPPVR